MATYNGHKNWNHWNVSLWINNDESLYYIANECIRRNKTLDDAAAAMLSELSYGDVTATPDGAPYSFSSIRAALGGVK
jgi:hypothetical protein